MSNFLTSIDLTTKEKAAKIADRLYDDVMEGETNALEMHVKLTALEKMLADVKKRIADHVMTEADKYGAKIFDAYSAKIEIAELGVKYDFQQCGDPEWNEANVNEVLYANQRKDREKLLKVLKHPMELIDPVSGEVNKVYPPFKTSTTGIKITLR